MDNWHDLTPTQQKNALKKQWYLRWSFRVGNKMIRQNNIKADVNYLKTKNERCRYLESLKTELINLIESGWSPYESSPFDEGITELSVEKSIEFVMEIWQKNNRTKHPARLQIKNEPFL